MSDEDDSYISSEDEDFVLGQEGSSGEEEAEHDSDTNDKKKKGGSKAGKGKSGKSKKHKKGTKSALKGLGGIDADEIADVREEALAMYGAEVLASEENNQKDMQSASENTAMKTLWEEMAAESGVRPVVASGLTGKGIGSELKHDMQSRAVLSGVYRRGQTADDFLTAVNMQGQRSKLLDGTAAASGMKRKRSEADGAAVSGEAASDAARKAEQLKNIAAAALAAASNTKLAVTQTVKFAGQTMQVTKLVEPGREPIAAKPKASITDVIAGLDRPEAISTLTKTSLDWDQYKYKHGIDDELTLATKDGYVDKQEFLQRVEGRQYEAAREKRAIERAKQDLLRR